MGGRNWGLSLALIVTAAFSTAIFGCSAEGGDSEGRDRSGPLTDDDPFGNSNKATAGNSGDFGNPQAGVGVPTAGTSALPLGDSCARVDVNVNRTIPRVTLVVDGSGSMNDGFGGQSRWTALRTALVDPGSGLVAQLENTVEFGLALYARSDPNVCPDLVQVPVALNNFTALSGQYPDRELGGGTPTGEALSAVVSMLPDNSVVLDDDPQPEIIILATDGMPNGCGLPPDQSICPNVPPLIPGFPEGPDPLCVLDYFANLPPDYQGTVDAAYAAQAKGIRLYVISLAPGQQEQGQLQRVANVGQGLDENASPGAPIFEPANPEALRETLATIIGGAVGCELQLQGRLDMARACEGNVTLNGNELACDGDPGWRALDPTRIELVGQACTDFLSDPTVMIAANWPCGVILE